MSVAWLLWWSNGFNCLSNSFACCILVMIHLLRNTKIRHSRQGNLHCQKEVNNCSLHIFHNKWYTLKVRFNQQDMTYGRGNIINIWEYCTFHLFSHYGDKREGDFFIQLIKLYSNQGWQVIEVATVKSTICRDLVPMCTNSQRTIGFHRGSLKG